MGEAATPVEDAGARWRFISDLRPALLSLSTFLPSSAHPWHWDGAALSLTCWVGSEGEVPTVIVAWGCLLGSSLQFSLFFNLPFWKQAWNIIRCQESAYFLVVYHLTLTTVPWDGWYYPQFASENIWVPLYYSWQVPELEFELQSSKSKSALLLPNFIISRPSRNFDIIVRTSLSSRILLSFCLQCPLHTAVSLSRPSPRLERTGDSWLTICFKAFHFNSSITQNCFL